MVKKKLPLINRDISWLSFNERVLQEAEDPLNPLLERLRFLGIYSNNRDEFYRVRIATIRRMAHFGKKGKQIFGEEPGYLLEKIQKIILKQQIRFDKLYDQILKELRLNKVLIINEKQLNEEQNAFVKNYFHNQVFPHLVPIMIDTVPKFPYLKDKAQYLAIKINLPGNKKGNMFSLIEVPSEVVSRFLVLPSRQRTHYVILLEDIIRSCLDEIFKLYAPSQIESYTLKLTRDAELEIDSDISKSWVQKIEKSVKMRKKGTPVRIAYDQNMPKDLLGFIVSKININSDDYHVPGGKYHNFKDFINFPAIDKPGLWNKPILPLEHPDLKGKKSTFSVIRDKDVLLTYPYQSYSHIINLLREAAVDPNVNSIKITLYRTAQNSSIVNALVSAIKNGKHVTAVVELQARFDEETNIFYATKLQEEGVNVIFGVAGLKVHSKLFLITRKENKKIVKYAHIGTGNFNEQTAKIYSDHSLLTANPLITREVDKLFGFYKDNYKSVSCKHLIVSPFNTRKKFMRLIDNEIKNRKNGKEAWIMLKMNSLVDEGMIRKLYEASSAGVIIRLIVRGICSLVPGVKNLSEHIEVISIVDKYLEHSRIFIFCNNNDEKVYLSSGDWMYRNLDNRSEVAVPVFDPMIKNQLREYLRIQFSDNTKARVINARQNNKFIHGNKEDGPIRAQNEIYNWLKKTDR